jgi:tetraacyldisaccharide 4'-kinase
MNLFLFPVAKFFELAVRFRNSIFDRQWISVYNASVPILSIGNLTVGGTGKTPITQLCLEYLTNDNLKVGVISRSYLAEVKKPCEVDLKHPKAARYFGDEPVLLAEKHPRVSFFVGPKKWQTVQFAVSKYKFDILVIDDGFQHRRLRRNFDIVILDATDNYSRYEMLPLGRGREPWSELRRADLIILNKSNMVSKTHLEELRMRLPENKEVLCFDYSVDKIVHYKSEKTLNLKEIKGKKFLLVSAIARPDIFEKMVAEFGVVSADSIHYRDHYQYTPQDVVNILAAYQKSGADFILTTEKDRVKLLSLIGDSDFFWSAPLVVMEKNEKGRLNEIIRQLYR